MKVGLLLGSFDPPHIGHILMAAYAFNYGMDMVWVAPCWSNPFKFNQTSFDHRFSMCFDTFKGIDRIDVMSDDRDIKSTSTYEYLNKAAFIKNPNNEYYIIVGSDIDISTWYNGQWILDNFKIIKVPRLGFEDNMPVGIKCSSTDIRKMVKEKKMLFPYLNQEVIKYIKYNNLYND